MTAYQPTVGDIVEDTEKRSIGKVMGFVGCYVQLRPIGGGLEWDAPPEALRPATASQALSEGTAKANARSRGERL